MKVPSKKPPATPTVQLLISAALEFSSAGLAERFCAAHGDAGSSSSAARTQVHKDGDMRIAGFPCCVRSVASARAQGASMLAVSLGSPRKPHQAIGGSGRAQALRRLVPSSSLRDVR